MGEAEYETIVIPKGTLLFRGIDSVESLVNDFAGIRKGNTNQFCLTANYNVFFYPFPFVANSVNEDYESIVVFVTSRDLQLINLILPSKFHRADRDTGKGGITTCSKVKMGCGIQGQKFDPCVNYDEISTDVSGMIAIAEADARTLKDMKEDFEKWNGKYFTSYKDSRGAVGVPEFILHPLKDNAEKTENITDFQPWYKKNKDTFNYKFLHILDNEPKIIQEFMDEFLSKDGMDLGDEEPYFLKMNKKNGFFQVQELSDNTSDLISVDLRIKSADMTLKRKDIYKVKQIKKDYPLADTIPASVLYWLKKDNVDKKGDLSFVNIKLTSDAYDFLEKHSDKRVLYQRFIVEKKGDLATLLTKSEVFPISGHYYALGLTPKGIEIKNNSNDIVFPEDHPMRNEVSAYEVVRHPIKELAFVMVNKTPAREINGILKYFAEKKGLLGGSRRRTLRRRLFRS
jgi:hypothetical protein